MRDSGSAEPRVPSGSGELRFTALETSVEQVPGFVRGRGLQCRRSNTPAHGQTQSEQTTGHRHIDRRNSMPIRPAGAERSLSVSPELESWAVQGSHLTTAVGGHRVFFRQVGDPSAAPSDTLLILHGFPESSFSFHKVLAGLAEHFGRVVLFDMQGFGLSDKPVKDFGYSLFEQADVALQVWRHLGVRGGHLLAHDMGDSVATELAARQVGGTLPGGFDKAFQSFTFTNGSMVLALARLRISQRILLSRWGRYASGLFSYRSFCQQVLSAHGAHGLGDRDLQQMWENLCLQEGHRKNHLTIRYVADRRRFETTRWLPALGRVAQPIHLCWGDADAVARVEIAHWLKANVCLDARLSLMRGVGHFCQLSDPEIWCATVCRFYADLGPDRSFWGTTR